MTCSKLAAIELELYCKITLMYKCCWHWRNQWLVNNNARNNETGTMTCSKPANTPLLQRRRNRWHMCYWHETNQYLASKQGRKQITGTVTCSKSAANTLGLHKYHNTNGICCCRGTNLYAVSKQFRKWNNWNNDLFKVNSKCIRIMQTKWHRWCMLKTLDRSLFSRNICND